MVLDAGQVVLHLIAGAEEVLLCRASPASGCRCSQVPHGALQDSGMVAAAAYSLLTSTAEVLPPPPAAAATLPILLLGTNNFSSSPPACLSSAAAWRTSLGEVPVDLQLNAELAAAGLPYDDMPHK